MIAMKLGWAVLEGICVWLTLYYGSGGALALGAMLLILPLGSLPIHLCLRKRLRVWVEAPAVARKGDEGSVTVWLENPTLLPALRIRCRMTARNQLNGESCTQHVMTWAFPKGQRRASLRLGSEYCGRIRISVEQVKLYDCLGLIGVPCGCTGEAHMTVQPDTFPIRVNLIPNPDSQEDSDSYSQERPGADLTETFQIREYVPGDSIRQIHWKLSGKFDRLIVRDPALPITRNVLVFWERTGQSGNVRRIDAQAEAVVSLCRSLADGGVQFMLGWNDTEGNVCVLHEICAMEDLVGVIPSLLRAAGRSSGVGGASLLVQTRPDALCGHMVYIGEEPCADVLQMQRLGHVTALLCGESPLEGSIPFDVGRYREQLGEIDV